MIKCLSPPRPEARDRKNGAEELIKPRISINIPPFDNYIQIIQGNHCRFCRRKEKVSGSECLDTISIVSNYQYISSITRVPVDLIPNRLFSVPLPYRVKPIFSARFLDAIFSRLTTYQNVRFGSLYNRRIRWIVQKAIPFLRYS